MRRVTLLVILLLLTVAWSSSFVRPALCRWFGLYRVSPQVVLPAELPVDPTVYWNQWKRAQVEMLAKNLRNQAPWGRNVEWLQAAQQYSSEEQYIGTQRRAVFSSWLVQQSPLVARQFDAEGRAPTAALLAQAFPDINNLHTDLVASFFRNPTEWEMAYGRIMEGTREDWREEFSRSGLVSAPPAPGQASSVIPSDDAVRIAVGAVRALTVGRFLRREYLSSSPTEWEQGFETWSWWGVVVF